MPLKGLVTQGSKVYALSKGSRQVLKQLEEVEESKLPEKILALEKSPDVGVAITKNIINILIVAIRVELEDEYIKQSKLEIEKLKEEGQKLLKPSTFTSLIYGENVELEQEYKSFINSAFGFIDEVMAKRHDFILQLQRQNKQLKIELEEMKQALAAKTDVPKKQDEIKQVNLETAKKIMRCLSLEYKFNQSYLALSSAEKEKKEIQDIYQILSTIYTRILSCESQLGSENKIDLPNDDFKLQIDELCSKCLLPIEVKSKHFYVTAKLMFNSLKESLPKNISLHDIEIYRACAKGQDRPLFPSFSLMPSFMFPYMHHNTLLKKPVENDVSKALEFS